MATASSNSQQTATRRSSWARCRGGKPPVSACGSRLPPPSAATTLVAHSVTAGSQYFQVGDYAFGGRRTRSVYVHRGPDFMLVLDRDAGAHTYQQLWHLDPGLTVTRVTANAAVATAPGTTLTIARIALPGQVIPAGSTTIVKGKTNPYQAGSPTRRCSASRPRW